MTPAPAKNTTQTYLPILLALLTAAGGYSIGRQQMEWQSTLLSPPAEDRDSFCQIEWMIADFQNKFVSAHCDSMIEALGTGFWPRPSPTGGGNNTSPKAAATTPCPAPSQDLAARIATLTRQLEKLEQGNPAPLLLRDLLRLTKQAGRQEEYQRLLSRACRSYPDHSFEPVQQIVRKGLHQ